MTLSTGLGSALGAATETTYGTYVPPTSWVAAFNSEGLDLNKEFDEVPSLNPDVLVQQDGLHIETVRHAEGPMEITPTSAGLGPYLSTLHGDEVVPTGTGAAKTQTHVVGTSVPDGKSLSLTVRIPGVDGVPIAKRVTGVTVNSVTFKMDAKGHLESTWNVHAQDVAGAASPPTPTFPAAFEAFGFAGATVEIDGSAPDTLVKAWETTITFAKNADRYGLGGAGVTETPLTNGLIVVTSKVTLEFKGLTQFNAFKNATRRSMTTRFEGKQALEPGVVPSIEFDTPILVATNGPTPKASGPDIVTTEVEFKALGRAGTDPLTITTVSADTAI